MAVQRRFVDFTGAPEWMRGEFLQLAGEADEARAQVVAAEEKARDTNRKTALGAVLIALLSGLLGYWRGRRAAAARVAVRAPK